jgi:serine/threonine protein kinase
MSGLVGRTLGKYRILARLGRGGTAIVYKAFQPRLDRYVAIKALHRHLAEDEDFIRRFEREASAVAGLRHPNIVQVHDFDHTGDLYYMVMEFIEGPSLRKELHARSLSGKLFTLPEIARVFGALGSAIDYAHEQGMVHHDLKPANILFTAQGQTVLTDFGIAKIVGGSTQTLTGAVFGTPKYMSPEQGQGQRGDERSDIYSLGIILFEMVTGQVPFDDDTPYTTISRHISEPLPLPSSLKSDLPSEVDRVILKAAAKSPDDRYQSGRELARALYDAVGLSVEHTLVSAPVVPLAEVAQLRTVDLDADFPPYIPTDEMELPLVSKTVALEPPSPPLWRRPLFIAGAIALLLLIVLTGAVALRVGNDTPGVSKPTPTPSWQLIAAATQTAVALASANTPAPPPTSTPTNTPTNTPSPTSTHTPTSSPTATSPWTPTPTSTETPTPTPSPTPTDTPTFTPTVEPPSPTPAPIGPADLYNRILFKTDRDGTTRIYSMNPDGSDQRPVPDPLIYLELAAWESFSPDRSKQIVVRTEGNAELWLITLDGSQDEWRITYDPGQDFDPAWSPTGDLIAYVSEKTGSGDIYISTPLGFEAERITLNKDPFDRHPTWSPDGRYLAFWSNAQYSLKQIYIYDTSTGETHLVGGGPYNNRDPLWAK